MIGPFHLKRTPRLIFGPGKLSELPAQLSPFGSSILVITGNSSLMASPYWTRFADACKDSGLTISIEQVLTEPSPDLIDSICSRQGERPIDAVVAIGGGSVLDAGKAVSAMLVEQKPTYALLEGVGSETPCGIKLPFVAVPTTSGTGSEATSNAVLSRTGPDGFKKSLRHDNYIPDLALLDPELTLSCPRTVTAACGMDALTQLVEAYLSTNASPLTDALALDGIRYVIRSLETACDNGDNLAARCDLAYGSYLSGIVLANAGLGAVHGLAGPIGGLFPIPHGVACGLLMAPINRITLARLRQENNSVALTKYQQLGALVATSKDDRDQSEQFLAFLDMLTAKLLPMKLADYSLSSSDISKLVAKGSNKCNPIALTDEEMTNALTTLC